MELINTLYNQKGSAAASYSMEIQNWLNLLLQLVDVTHCNAIDCLKLFFCGKYKAAEKHGAYISCCVSINVIVHVFMRERERERMVLNDLFVFTARSHGSKELSKSFC